MYQPEAPARVEAQHDATPAFALAGASGWFSSTLALGVFDPQPATRNPKSAIGNPQSAIARPSPACRVDGKAVLGDTTIPAARYGKTNAGALV
jgi:hypothetical protein